MSDDKVQREPTVLFDTEVIVGRVGDLEHGLQMFQRPLGQTFALVGSYEYKTCQDTNMMMAACLPQPYQFELEGVFLSLSGDGSAALRESLKSAALTVEVGWHVIALRMAMWHIPVNPMESIVEVIRNNRKRWWLREPFALAKAGLRLGLSEVLSVNVKWEPEFKKLLPPSKLRVALVGNFVMPQGYWEYLKQEEQQP